MKPWIILIYLMNSLQANEISNRTWHGFESSCYTILTTEDCVGIDACSESCNSFNAYLVEIDTAAELLFLQQLVEGDNGQYWVGVEFNGTDRTNGVHRWIRSKQVVDPAFWKVNDPDYFANSCTRFHRVPGEDYLLNVRNPLGKQCLDKYSTLCETSVRIQASTSFKLTSVTSDVCGKDGEPVRSRTECAKRCAMTLGCVGFHYNSEIGGCRSYARGVGCTQDESITHFYLMDGVPCSLT